MTYPTLDQLMPQVLLDEMISEKYVRIQYHPDEPLAILNYTDKCTYDKAWNEVTTQCRGLIVNHDTNEVVARPFRKFFNFGEPSCPDLPQDALVTVTDKMDGSLGILYREPCGGQLAIATRGSFTSDQAFRATHMLREFYGQSNFRPSTGVTYLFEIIYPENRIVLNYANTMGLFLLGGVDLRTGNSMPPDILRWPGPMTDIFYEIDTLQEALQMPPRENSEGIVVHFLASDQRVKIKQADYVALHRVLTGTNARTVWEFLAVNACKHLQGTKITAPTHWGSYLMIDAADAKRILAAGDDWLEKLLAGVPDEFHSWLRETIDQLERQAATLTQELRETATVILDVFGPDRKAMAQEVFRRDLSKEKQGIVFQLLDGHDVTTSIWKAIRPEATKGWLDRGEDVA